MFLHGVTQLKLVVLAPPEQYLSQPHSLTLILKMKGSEGLGPLRGR